METVFVTKKLAGKVLFDDKGLIGKFKNSNNDLVQGDDGIKRHDMRKEQIWFMELTDPDKIKRAKEYPGFGTKFEIYDGKPIYNTLNNLKVFAGSTGIQKVDQEQLKSEIKKELETERQQEKVKLAAASKEYGLLYGELHKIGGILRKDADPVKLARLNELGKILDIKEEVLKEEEVAA